MAQYASYNNAISSSSIQIKSTNDGTKRVALSSLNTNQTLKRDQGKSFPWKKTDAPTTSKQPSVENANNAFNFQIFEDVSMEIKGNAIKEISLPACVTQLLTYKNSDFEDAKENEPYWILPEAAESQIENQKDVLNWTCPFRDDVFQYLKDLEVKFRPRPLYLSLQPDITNNMRMILVDWMIEVGEEYKLSGETVHLAVAYTDRFLSSMSVLKKKLQLVGTTCMFISSKHEEIYPPELKDFVYITDDTYEKQQILKMEQLILNILKFDLATPTAYTFVQVFSSMGCVSDKVSCLAQYICDMSLLEATPFLGFLPSQIGAACVALANHTLGFSAWSEELASLSGYTLQDIAKVVQSLYEMYNRMSSYEQQAVRDKYKSSKYHCVSDVQCPEHLII